MKSLEHYTDVLETTLEKVATLDDQTKKTLKEKVEIVFNRDISNYLRLETLLYLLKDLISEKLIDQYLNSLYDISELPFCPDKLKFINRAIGIGTESIVYLLKSKEVKTPSYVLKIIRSTKYKTNDTKDLIELAKKRKTESEEIYKLFSEMPSLILGENLTIIQNPKKKEGVVASVQKFVGYDLKDIFTTPIEEIRQMCVENPNLKTEINKFYEINERIYRENEKIIDLNGPNNTSIVQGRDNKPHLVFIDPHLTVSSNVRDADGKKSLQNRIDKLNNLKHITESI